jgi:hypothetical protein
MDYEDDDKTAQANKILGFYDDLGLEKAIHPITHQATVQRRFNSSFLGEYPLATYSEAYAIDENHHARHLRSPPRP